MCVHRKFGAAGFVAFSGLSILPRRVTATDLAIRVGAAVYLRLFSRSFRAWVAKIEGVHLFTWLLRAVLVLGALLQLRRETTVTDGGKAATNAAATDEDGRGAWWGVLPRDARLEFADAVVLGSAGALVAALRWFER